MRKLIVSNDDLKVYPLSGTYKFNVVFHENDSSFMFRALCQKDLEYRILKVFVRLVAKFCVWLFICIYIKYQNVKSYFLFFVDGKCFKWKLNKLRCHWYNLKKSWFPMYTPYILDMIYIRNYACWSIVLDCQV